MSVAFPRACTSPNITDIIDHREFLGRNAQRPISARAFTEKINNLLVRRWAKDADEQKFFHTLQRASVACAQSVCIHTLYRTTNTTYKYIYRYKIKAPNFAFAGPHTRKPAKKMFRIDFTRACVQACVYFSVCFFHLSSALRIYSLFFFPSGVWALFAYARAREDPDHHRFERAR